MIFINLLQFEVIFGHSLLSVIFLSLSPFVNKNEIYAWNIEEFITLVPILILLPFASLNKQKNVLVISERRSEQGRKIVLYGSQARGSWLIWTYVEIFVPLPMPSKKILSRRRKKSKVKKKNFLKSEWQMSFSHVPVIQIAALMQLRLLYNELANESRRMHFRNHSISERFSKSHIFVSCSKNCHWEYSFMFSLF